MSGPSHSSAPVCFGDDYIVPSPITETSREHVVEEIKFSRRFEGLASSVNGGYLAGILGERLDSRSSTTRLHSPVPLETPVYLFADSKSIELRHCDRTLATALPGSQEVEDAPFVAVEDIVEAAEPPLDRGIFADCFVCGRPAPTRSRHSSKAHRRRFGGIAVAPDQIASHHHSGGAGEVLAERPRLSRWVRGDHPSPHPGRDRDNGDRGVFRATCGRTTGGRGPVHLCRRKTSRCRDHDLHREPGRGRHGTDDMGARWPAVLGRLMCRDRR